MVRYYNIRKLLTKGFKAKPLNNIIFRIIDKDQKLSIDKVPLLHFLFFNLK